MINTNYSLLNSNINNSSVQAYSASNNVQTNTTVQNSSTYNTDDTAVILTLSSEAKEMEAATYDAAKSSTLKVGSKGDAVKTLQSNLITLGYLTGKADGIFGANTKKAVAAFQRAYGLDDDGVVGSKTQDAITKALNYHKKGVLTKGSRGTAVKTLQSNLKTLGYLSDKADGIFGANTKKAVVAFQKACGLDADGIVGKDTKAAIEKTIKYKNKGILIIGSKGSDVKEIQSALKKLGYLSGNADGIFDTNTKKAVVAFKKANGLAANGQVGSKTKKAILDAVKKIKDKDIPTTPSKDGIPQFQGHNDLGYLSAKFEAHAECGTISSGAGDNGGKSYGLYQFASGAGTPISFVKWLKNKNTDIYNKLIDAYNADGKKYGSNFDKAWKELAKKNTNEFSELQYKYTKEKYYDSSVQKIKENLNFDVTKRGYTLNAVIWSRGVQMGGCSKIFERAVKGMDLSKASDEDIIRAIYKENAKLTSEEPNEKSNIIKAKDGDKYGITGKYLFYFSKSSSNIQAGVYNRLTNTELNEALKLLKNFG